MNLFEFATESPVLTFFLILITYCFIESLFKIAFKDNNHD